jgi:hypothetical protein
MNVCKVGVGSISDCQKPTELKRYAFFLDELRIAGLATTIPILQVIDNQSAAEIKYLSSVGFVQDTPTLNFDNIEDIEDGRKDIIKNSLDELRTTLTCAKSIFDTVTDSAAVLSVDETAFHTNSAAYQMLGNNALAAVTRLNEIHKRLAAVTLRTLHGMDALCVNSLHANPRAGDIDRVIGHQDVINILVDGLCIPDDRTSWQDVLSFRSEYESPQLLRQLRVWVTELIHGKLTYREASEKIDYLKNEYKANARRAGVRATLATVKTMVVGSASMIENSLKLRLAALAEAPFKLLEARAALVEEERKVPGRDLAFMVRVEDRFQ